MRSLNLFEKELKNKNILEDHQDFLEIEEFYKLLQHSSKLRSFCYHLVSGSKDNVILTRRNDSVVYISPLNIYMSKSLYVFIVKGYLNLEYFS